MTFTKGGGKMKPEKNPLEFTEICYVRLTANGLVVRDVPRFLPEIEVVSTQTGVTMDGKPVDIANLPCLACNDVGPRDKAARLCKACWRTAVFSVVKSS